jgi:hypothetical protein
MVRSSQPAWLGVADSNPATLAPPNSPDSLWIGIYAPSMLCRICNCGLISPLGL